MSDEARFTLGPWSACKDGDCECGMIWDATEECLVAVAQGPPHLGKHGGEPDCTPNAEPQRANARLIAAAPELYVRLADLILIIDKAGLLNLSNGVQLGATSWYVKAFERLELARRAVLKAADGSVVRDAEHVAAAMGAQAP